MSIDGIKLEEFVSACHKAAKYNLVKCSSGNMSWQISESLALLSASSSWLSELSQDQVSVCQIQSGQCVNGINPTCESVFHLGILKNRLQHNVVLHFQSPYATAIACGDPSVYNFNVIIEIPVYIGKPAVVEYYPPGSQELADAVINAMKDHDLAILKNHGLVTVGKNFDDAIQKAVFFELACKILLTQSKPETLTEEQVDYLRSLGKA